MESAHNDGLSASAAMQNAEQSEIRREELIKGSLDEDIESVGMQLGKGKGEERVRVAGEMEDLFSSQDLNAIRRFLGMSLQQINANKVLENGRAKVRGSFSTRRDFFPYDYHSGGCDCLYTVQFVFVVRW